MSRHGCFGCWNPSLFSVPNDCQFLCVICWYPVYNLWGWSGRSKSNAKSIASSFASSWDLIILKVNPEVSKLWNFDFIRQLITTFGDTLGLTFQIEGQRWSSLTYWGYCKTGCLGHNCSIQLSCFRGWRLLQWWLVMSDSFKLDRNGISAILFVRSVMPRAPLR